MEERKELPADPSHERRAGLNQRLRQAFIAGADENSRLGRGLNAEEQGRVLRRYSATRGV